MRVTAQSARTLHGGTLDVIIVGSANGVALIQVGGEALPDREELLALLKTVRKSERRAHR